MTEERGMEERVEQLLRRSDGPMVIRPLARPAVSGSTPRRLLTSVLFVLIIVTSGAVAISVITARRQPVATQPSATALATSELPASTRPSASFGADFASAEEAAAAIAQGLERGDTQLLVRTLAPSDWYARWYQQSQTDPMTRTEAWNWILNSPRATWRVDAANVRDADPGMPLGERYISALATDFGGWPEQRAAIMLRSIAGRWYWSSLLLFRPPPITAGPGEVAGYATLLNVTDATLSVRFRTVGSRCCSDESWSGRSASLRREVSTVYMGPGGTSAASLADSGTAAGTDVWVRFSVDSVVPDGSYRLAELVKMYP
jgi:hypothetical protein